LAAFLHFQEEECDYAIVECGWGGRKDATNILEEKVLCILTHIELEHTEVLGKNIPEITKEKLGVCRPSVPLLTSSSQVPEVYEVMHEMGIEAIHVPSIEIGEHHPESCGLAVTAAEYLNISVSPEIRAALEVLQIPGHFQVIEYGKHTLVVDGAHTYDSILYIREKVLHYAQIHGLPHPFWGIHFLSDKRVDLHALFPRQRTVWIRLDDVRAGTCPSDLSAFSVSDILKQLQVEEIPQLFVFAGSFRLAADVLKRPL